MIPTPEICVYTTDGRLAILDWSLVGFLGEQERVAMGQILLAAITLNNGTDCHRTGRLAEADRVDRIALSEVVDNWLRRIRRGHFPGLTWLVGMLDEATQTAGLRVAADLMLFRKSLLTLEGVIGELGADDFQIDNVVLSEFVRHFGRRMARAMVFVAGLAGICHATFQCRPGRSATQLSTCRHTLLAR